MFDVKLENDKLRSCLREKDVELEIERSNCNRNVENAQRRTENLEKIIKNLKDEVQSKNRVISELRLNAEDLIGQKSQLSERECPRCVSAYQDLNVLKQQVESINMESLQRRELYRTELNDI